MKTEQLVQIIANLSISGAIWWGLLWPSSVLAGIPNGTWLSQPQIRYYSSSNLLSQVMQDIQRQQYRVVFLDFRGVPD